MRREEFQITDEQTLTLFLERSLSGTLSMVDSSGAPYCVPLNFVYSKPSLFVHSAAEGRKIECLSHEPRVCFLVHREFSLIPSYFTSNTMACHATHFFISAMLEGEARFCKEPAQKAEALSSLMVKYQSEGGYEALRAQEPLYRKALEETTVVEVAVKSVSGKFKFGQNLSSSRFQDVLASLRKRGEPLDLETIEWMERLFPGIQGI